MKLSKSLFIIGFVLMVVGAIVTPEQSVRTSPLFWAWAICWFGALGNLWRINNNNDSE